MAKEKSSQDVALQSDRLGDDKKIKAILTDWGMSKAAIRRMLDEHKARQSSMTGNATAGIKPATGRHVRRSIEL